MYSLTFTKGYSLVEVLIAVSILMIAIVSPLTIAAKSIQSAQYARQQTTAFFLAQEGITAIRVVRDDAALTAFNDPSGNTLPWAWINNPNLPACFALTGCNIDFRSANILNNVSDCSTLTNCSLQFESGNPTPTNRRPLYEKAGVATPYTRIIKLTASSPDEVTVVSEVQWTSNFFGGNTESVVLETSVLNVYK
jgi:type II secretory pathway pseudopilin PulG